MIHHFRTVDHPEANGRLPVIGDQQWTLTFPHENGDDYIEIHMGKRGREAMRDMLKQEDADDQADKDSK